MKKIICPLSIVVILFNFIFCNSVYATDEDFQGIDSITEESVTPADQESLINAGTVINDVLGGLVPITFGTLGNIFGAVAGIIAAVLNLFPMITQLAMTIVSGAPFTIENAVFNMISLFNINYLNFSDSYTVGSKGNAEQKIISTDNAMQTLKNRGAQTFIVIRLIATAISLLVLIYVGIRMALSTIASDKAKYQKMFMGWLESIVILFLMQYIVSILFSIGESAGNILYEIKVRLDTNGSISFEQDIMDKIYSFIFITSGWEYVLYSVMYWVLIFLQTKFFFMYFRRVITVGFLILIGPAVTVTYTIDKVGDGKAQAFTVWFAELVVNIMIQPIHAAIYLVFMYTAGEIAKQSMLISLLFLLSMTKVERFILQLFNLRNVASLRPVGDERKKG